MSAYGKKVFFFFLKGYWEIFHSQMTIAFFSTIVGQQQLTAFIHF